MEERKVEREMRGGEEKEGEVRNGRREGVKGRRKGRGEGGRSGKERRGRKGQIRGRRRRRPSEAEEEG